MRHIEFWYGDLPKRSLSPNSRAHHSERSDFTYLLRTDVAQFLLDHESIIDLKEPLRYARINVLWKLTTKRPTVDQCPRCRLMPQKYKRWAKDKNKVREGCLCYRPKDGGNAISALKPFYDGITDAGVWPDDDFDHLEIGRVARQLVGALSDEGLWVEIEEIP